MRTMDHINLLRTRASALSLDSHPAGGYIAKTRYVAIRKRLAVIEGEIEFLLRRYWRERGW